MATVTEQPEEYEKREIVGETRIAIHGVSYEFYKQFCEEIGEQPVRMSFNDECLEIMITKSPHEYFKKLLAKLIEATIYELDIPVRSGGAMTFQRDDLKKGFEPGECWWIQNEATVRQTTDFDFSKDPPPDLAIEVEISRGLARRIEIYAAMKVPEVWRFDGRKLRFCQLGSDGTYVDQSPSRAFPFLRPEHIVPFLRLPDEDDETRRVKKYVEWLRAARREPKN